MARAQSTRGRTAKAQPAKLSQRLVLSGWVLSLLEVRQEEGKDRNKAFLDDLAGSLDAATDGQWIGPDGVSWFHRRLTSRLERVALSHADLMRYDENHPRGRGAPLRSIFICQGLATTIPPSSHSTIATVWVSPSLLSRPQCSRAPSPLLVFLAVSST